MEHWPQVKIGDICIVERGGSPRPIDKYITNSENGINWIKIGDTDDSMYITSTAQKIIPEGAKKSRYVQSGDFLLSNSMSFGRPYILKIDGCIHDGWLVLRDNNGLFDKRFLYYYLSAPSTYQKFKSLAVGGVVNNLNSEMVRNVYVPLPALDEQDKIATKLDKLSNLIFLRKQQLVKLDELVKARFVEMFGTYPSNQKEWETCTIRDIASDVRYGTSRPAIDGGAYPYLRMNNITYGGELDLSDIKQIDIPKNELPKCTVMRGDVLFNRTNSKELVGKTCVYDRDEMMVLAGFIIRIRVNKKILPNFLSGFLNADFSKQMLLSMSKAAIGQANINAQELQDIKLYLPPIELQREFVNFKGKISSQKLTIQQSLDKLEVLKKLLMQEYFG